MKHTNRLRVCAAMIGALGLSTQISLAGGHISSAQVALHNIDGTQVGAAEITQSPHGVLVHLKVTDLPPGAKGVHFHSKAHCAADTGFKSSHGHHGEAKGEHGLLNPIGPGKGDLGNLYVGESGVGELQFFKPGVFLDKGDQPLLDEDGTAIVIHANEDDQITQPIGGAGVRIVCGIVKAG
ncbi:MAG: superoxide dismutase family protein [Litoreibacter sp.]|uniref:superoxide dismutase family protein n=1 Tax=Litoreibacter sp. TaxID=1969459 RepID=UPI0032992E5E